MLLKAVAAFLVLIIVVAGYLFASYRLAVSDAERAWTEIARTAVPPPGVFDPAMVSGLPEVAQRYFLHAIAPGTPLKTTVELRLKGVFLLGDKNSSQSYDMEARQILAPPDKFVWMPVLRSGPLTITGSDAVLDGRAWMRFWIASLFPVADIPTSPDLVCSAQFRSAIESIWAPAAILPRDGIAWKAVGPDTASVTIDLPGGPVVLQFTLDQAGALKAVVGLRWSDANPQKRFQLQPFGGTMEEEATFDGYTIPSVVKVGNMFGTADYFAFYQAQILQAVYK